MKKIITIFIALVVAFLSYGVYMSKQTMPQRQNIVPTSNIGKSWKGLDFEPGFYFEIAATSTDAGYFTKVLFQEGGQVEGNLQKLVDTDDLKVYEGLLLLGGDGNVPTKMEIQKAACTKPSGDTTEYKTKLTFATDVFTGCAE
jgi:hypothetical protein